MMYLIGCARSGIISFENECAEKLLYEYNVVQNRELHRVWDFKECLEPHMHPIRGFATSQFGDGMHEFILRKDGQG
eukprot:1269085-Pleurochrysis_carterae.AAC.1